MFTIAQRDMQETFASTYWSIMTRKWKLYDAKLYNLLKDPGELEDVSASHEDLKKNLRKYAIKYIKRRQAKSSEKKVTLDRELREKLKTLGYLD
ncbi:MAG: hypothetical protein JSV88_28500, partial [Candidatus Aminicenantes bacterium]